MARGVKVFEDWLETRFGAKISRKADEVQKHLSVVKFGDVEKITSKKDAFIYIPYRFTNANMAFVDDRVRIVCNFAIVIDGFYGVTNLPSLIEIKPDSRKRIKINDIEYLEFSFEANSIVFDDVRLFQDSSMVYNIFNEEIAKGNVPLYFNDIDFLFCLDEVKDYANLSIGKNNVPIEMIVSAITRSGTDPKEYYRSNPNGDYQFIALRNIQLGATNTMSKMLGSYYEVGIGSALNKESDKLEDIERLLRL